MTKFPLCEELGLIVWERKGASYYYYVDAPALERLLSQAPVLYGWAGECWNEDTEMRDREETHTARLIGVKPIVKDTAESLLKEILEQLDLRLKEYGGGFYKFEASDALERARKLLEGR